MGPFGAALPCVETGPWDSSGSLHHGTHPPSREAGPALCGRAAPWRTHGSFHSCPPCPSVSVSRSSPFLPTWGLRFFVFPFFCSERLDFVNMYPFFLKQTGSVTQSRSLPRGILVPRAVGGGSSALQGFSSLPSCSRIAPAAKHKELGVGTVPVPARSSVPVRGCLCGWYQQALPASEQGTVAHAVF